MSRGSALGTGACLVLIAFILVSLIQQTERPLSPPATVPQAQKIEQVRERAYYQGLRQSIMRSQATLPDVIEALKQPYDLGIANTLYALHKMHHFRPLHHLLDSLWERDQTQHPDLNWQAIDSPRGRIALATTLMRIKITDTDDYVDYVRGYQDSDNPQVISQVAMFLGFNADHKDIEYLKRLAESDNQTVAEGAITGLSTFQGNRAKQTLIDLASKYEDTPRGTYLKQMLRDFYGWPPYQPYGR